MTYHLESKAKSEITSKVGITANAGRELERVTLNNVTAVDCFHSDMVKRLFKPIPDEKMMLLHAVIGISSEAGEIIDQVKKHVFYERPLDKENLIEELGDVMFYVQATAQMMGLSLTDLLSHNACKLQLNKNARYASGSYSNEQATERADKVIGPTDERDPDMDGMATPRGPDPIIPSIHLK